MKIMKIKELGNNRYEINGEDVYAPNLHTAKVRFTSKYPEFENDRLMLLANENRKLRVNHLSAVTAKEQRTPVFSKNNSYRQASHG